MKRNKWLLKLSIQIKDKKKGLWFGLYYVHKQIIAIDAILIK